MIRTRANAVHNCTGPHREASCAPSLPQQKARHLIAMRRKFARKRITSRLPLLFAAFKLPIELPFEQPHERRLQVASVRSMPWPSVQK